MKISITKSRQYIKKMDLSKVANKIQRMEKNQAHFINPWSLEDIQRGIQEYKNFLILKRKYGHRYKLPPSFEIDKVWHNHILDTKQYHEDCLYIFGEYLHHDPYFGFGSKKDVDELYKEFKITQKLYKKEFGVYLYQYD